MNGETLVIEIGILLAAALVGGMVAHRLRQPVILGYLLVGVLIGPYTMGIISDLGMVEAAATIGVALLMFTLGLEVSVDQLRHVGRVGLWGGVAQIMLTLLLGFLAGFFLFRWPVEQSILFGMVISLSSTAICFKLLMERGEISSIHGRIMIAILILQDIAVVLMTVVVSALGGSGQDILGNLALTAGKVIAFSGLAIALGVWVLPWLMGRIGGVRSREIFLLVVLVISIGAAIATQILGLSMVFGAFLVGLVLRKTAFANQALAEVTPLRDVFSSLFFISLGMLFDPGTLAEIWPTLIVLVMVIIFIKMAVVFGVVRLFGYSQRIALLSGAGLLQVGEFGFILAQDGLNSGLVSGSFYSLIVASAIITMILTPLSLSLASRLSTKAVRPVEIKVVADSPSSEHTARVLIAGYGRTGRSVAQGLLRAGTPVLIVDIDPEQISEARRKGIPAIYGDVTNVHFLSKLNLSKLDLLIITIPDTSGVTTLVKAARIMNPRIKILARVENDKEAGELKKLGVDWCVNPEYEASLEFLRGALGFCGLPEVEAKAVLPPVGDEEPPPGCRAI